MILRNRPPHRLALLAFGTVLVAAGMLAGCAPRPAPTPTPTAAFASEEEAFAAAEEVYRAYNEALGEVDPSDPASFEPLFALSQGSFEEADRENFSLMHAEGHRISGQPIVTLFEGIESGTGFDTVRARVCLDVHEVSITDQDGTSVVNPNRPDVYPLAITFTLEASGYLIDSADRIEDESCGGK